MITFIVDGYLQILVTLMTYIHGKKKAHFIDGQTN
jgi:hypothetical protein